MRSKKNKNEYIAIVPFRTGSKGLPGKNFLPIAGEPMWRRAVEQGVRTCGSVICSTDAELTDAVFEKKCVVYDRRPQELSDDATLMQDVIEHLIEKYQLHEKNLVLLQPTSPLRTDENVTAACNLYEKFSYDLVMSVSERDRRILKYGLISELNQFNFINRPEFCFSNRQQLPPIFGPNGAVYVFKASNFMLNCGFPKQNVGALKMNDIESYDLDTDEDYAKILQVLEDSAVIRQ